MVEVLAPKDAQKDRSLTHPTPARRDAPFHRKAAASEEAMGTYRTSCDPFTNSMGLGERINSASDPSFSRKSIPRGASERRENDAEGLFQHPSSHWAVRSGLKGDSAREWLIVSIASPGS